MSFHQTETKPSSCKFDSCGEIFTTKSELLDHVTLHLGEDTIIEDLHDVDESNYVMQNFHGLHGLVLRSAKVTMVPSPSNSIETSGTPGLLSLDNVMSPPTSPSRGLETEILGLDAAPFFSAFEFEMGRPEVEEDPLALSSPVNMDEILEPRNPCLELVSQGPLPILDNSIDWKALLQNYPSGIKMVDIMDYEDIMDASASTQVKIEAEQKFPPVHAGYSQGSPSNFGDISSTVDDLDESSDESQIPRSKTGKDLGRYWLPIPQGKPARFHNATTTTRNSPDLKYKRGQGRDVRNGAGKRGFRQELVTFVTTEKRTYRALVTTPRSKPKPNKKSQQNNQEVKYYSAEFILEEGLKKKRGNSHTLHKPYVCPVIGCGKSYKNPNGIKYHARYGHSAPQEFPCHCGKIYSTRHGLMAHKRTHSALSSPQSMADESFSYSETEESDEYRSNEMI